MPAEFSCPSCSQVLRTPDESRGKKARCPQCLSIVDVPLDNRQPSGAQQQQELIHESPTDPGGYTNPYASPTSQLVQDEKTELAGMTHSKVVLDDVLTYPWKILKSQIGPIIAVGFLYLVISTIAALFSGFLRIVGQLMGDMTVVIIGIVVQQVVAFAVNTFLQLGMIMFGLRVCRTGTARINDLFGAGKLYLRGLLLNLMIVVIVYAVVAVAGSPIAVVWVLTQDLSATFITGGIVLVPYIAIVTYVTLRLYLANCFLVDRNMSVFESLSASDQYMRGNKVTGFLASLVVGVGSVLVMLCTCGIGMIAVIPFTISLLPSIFYLLTTGQSVHDPERVMQR